MLTLVFAADSFAGPVTFQGLGQLDGFAFSTAHAISADGSTVVGTVDLDGSLDVAKLNAALRANGIVDTDGYRKLGRNARDAKE